MLWWYITHCAHNTCNKNMTNAVLMETFNHETESTENPVKMLQGEHSAKLLTFIKLPFVIKIFVLSIIEWPFYCTTGSGNKSTNITPVLKQGGQFKARKLCFKFSAINYRL